jgi:hypothetical protein
VTPDRQLRAAERRIPRTDHLSSRPCTHAAVALARQRDNSKNYREDQGFVEEMVHHAAARK